MDDQKLTLEEKIVVFQTLPIFKGVFQSLITIFPKYVVNDLGKIQTVYWRKTSTPKTKHGTLCYYYKG